MRKREEAEEAANLRKREEEEAEKAEARRNASESSGEIAAILALVVFSAIINHSNNRRCNRRHRSTTYFMPHLQIPFGNTMFMTILMFALVVVFCSFIKNALIVENPDELRTIGLLPPLIGVPIGIGIGDTAVNISLARDKSAIIDNCRKYINAMKK